MDTKGTLLNKNILVTGASSGIGKAICQKISEEGAHVIMVARREEQLKEVLASLAGTEHAYYVYDLMETEGIETLIKKIVADNGRLDGYVHSAGIGTMRPLKFTTTEFLHEVMTVNLYSFIEIARLYSNTKNHNGGSIIGISSYAAMHGDKAKTAYCASKAAMDGAVRAMAVELQAKGIRVTSVQPGWVRTDMLNAYMGKVNKDIQDVMASSAGMISEPEELAEMIAFLLSEKSAILSGVSILANKVGI